MQEVLNLGFACPWDTPRERTWSGTPWHLQQALEASAGVGLVDMPVTISGLLKTVARAKGLYRERGKWLSRWQYTPRIVNAYRQALTSQVANGGDVDAVLSVGEFGPVDRPLFLYQDFSFLHAVLIYDQTGQMPSQFAAFPLSMIRDRATQQQETFTTAAGVFTMSEWDRRVHIENGFVPAERMHNVGAGFNAMVTKAPRFEALDRSDSRERRVMFIGRDFYRKGGDQVVEAVRLWNDRSSYDVRLTIAGPTSWPMEGPIPNFVNFLSDVPKSVIARELAASDVSTLPSHFEAFGIAIVESLAAGVPVVGRDLCAMPELIQPGTTGSLVSTESAEELSIALEETANDDGLRATTIDNVPKVTEQYSWESVAASMVRTMKEVLR